MNRKVTVVAAPATSARRWRAAIADKELADVVIVDIADQKAAGVALDMLEACPIDGSDCARRSADRRLRRDAPNSDVVVITSGVPRKPGMSRDDLLNVNYKIMQAVTEQVVKYSPNCIIVPVANPLDAMCQAVYRLSEVPARARHRHGRRARLGAHAHVHRDGAERLGRERPRVRPRRPRRHDGAAAALLDGRRHPDHRADVEGDASTRSASAPPTAAPRSPSWSARAPGTRRARRRPRWSRRSCKDKKKILPCSVFLQGEYGVRDLFVGVPVKLGARGVEQIIQIKLTPEEDAALKKSAGAVKELVDVIGV